MEGNQSRYRRAAAALMAGPKPVLLMARELGLGGTERQLTEIARALAGSDFQPHVGCFHAEGFRAEELKRAGVPIVRFPVRSFYSFSAIQGARAMGTYLKRHRIQLVHTFDVPMNLFGVPAARLFRVPRVLSSQRAYRGLTQGWAARLLRLTDRLVNGIVVNCRAIQRHLLDDEGVPAGRIHLCYNGIDTDVFFPVETQRPLALANASIVIGVICALRPEKDLVTLLRAFAQVRKPGMRLAIVGAGPERPRLVERARELEIANDCHFEPATPAVADWLRAIDIFVLPSVSEALSNSLMEAMACGCCAVASNVGGNPELVAGGQTGMLFEAGNAGELASKLRILIQDEPLRKQLAEAGARFLQENFSLAKAARRMAEIYRET